MSLGLFPYTSKGRIRLKPKWNCQKSNWLFKKMVTA